MPARPQSAPLPDPQVRPIVEELRTYSTSVDLTQVRESILTIGRLGLAFPTVSSYCLDVLTSFLDLRQVSAASVAVVAMRDFLPHYGSLN